MRFNKFSLYCKEGLTLFETIMYVALLGLLAVMVANFLLQTVNTYNRARSEREVLSNARLILETVDKTIEQAADVYFPTSAFNTDLGQLALVTTIGAQPEHGTAYVDFWVDNGLFLMRQEGQSTTTISAASVKVSMFRVERILQGIGRRAVRVTLKVDSARAPFTASTTLNMTTVLRGNY